MMAKKIEKNHFKHELSQFFLKKKSSFFEEEKKSQTASNFFQQTNYKESTHTQLKKERVGSKRD